MAVGARRGGARLGGESAAAAWGVHQDHLARSAAAWRGGLLAVSLGLRQQLRICMWGVLLGAAAMGDREGRESLWAGALCGWPWAAAFLLQEHLRDGSREDLRGQPTAGRAREGA